MTAMRMSRFSIFLLVIVVLLFAGGAVYLVANGGAPPTLDIHSPLRVVGAHGTLEVEATAPGGHFTHLDVAVEQDHRRIPVFSLPGGKTARIQQVTPDEIRITEPFGQAAFPALQAGPARIIATASCPALFGLRHLEATAARSIQVDLTPPTVEVVSTGHYINLGGSEMVIYRVSPPDVTSGVRVGQLVYPGFPASGAGIPNADPGLKVAFFALRYDQGLDTPMSIFARDAAGNETTAQFDHQVFDRQFKHAKIQIDDAFLQRAIPPIMQHTPQVHVALDGPKDLVPAFLVANRQIRRLDAAKIASFASQTAPRILWSGAFLQLPDSKVESPFPEFRTYYHDGQEIDKEVHLGEDLASIANAKIPAANAGRVLFASYLGIYGNCVIIDHGMGVQSLYGHLSSIQVRPGEMVAKGQVIGLTGETGLAGGDHLHFTMLVDGQMVNPVEWWDPHWIADRITRKLVAAGAPAPAVRPRHR